MSASSVRIAIVGGGLAGLVAAWRLAQQGVRDVVLFEARPTLGGRIRSVDAAGAPVDVSQHAIDRFDLGPTWFWPALQPELMDMIDTLGLPRFAPFEVGDLLIERSPVQRPVRVGGDPGEPSAARLLGGTGALIAALVQRLDAAVLRAGHRVRRLDESAARVELLVEAPGGSVDSWRAGQVLLALPPRLAARLVFEPALPPDLTHAWRAAPTWMAPHAKYVAVYEVPFWRDQGLSGGARSAVGPLVEIHDVSMPGGHAALFGFVGVPAPVRRSVGDDALRRHCRAQMGRLFGEHAAQPVADVLKDWAGDPWTATDDDQEATEHPTGAPPAAAVEGRWAGRLIGIGSEWSMRFPGYLAGALDAAERGVKQVLVS